MINQPGVPDLGYDFHPGAADRFPGHPQLDIFLRDAPTRRHFDPERVHLAVAQTSQPEAITITHPWTGARLYRICANRIYIDNLLNLSITRSNSCSEAANGRPSCPCWRKFCKERGADYG